MTTQPAVTIDYHVLRWSTAGDTHLSIAPTLGGDTVPVIRYTSATGTRHAIQITRDELATIRDTANAILTAQPHDIARWLDHAANTALDNQGPPFQDTDSDPIFLSIRT